MFGGQVRALFTWEEWRLQLAEAHLWSAPTPTPRDLIGTVYGGAILSSFASGIFALQ